jgi:hypothetical protein
MVRALLIIAALCIAVTGCSKKEEPAMEKAKESAAKAVDSAKEAAADAGDAA